VQISGTTKVESIAGWKNIREKQREVAEKFNYKIIPSYDLSEYSDNIHLSDRSNIRLAERVFSCLFNNNCSPQIENILLIGDQIKIEFTKEIEAGPEPVLMDSSFRPIETEIIKNKKQLTLIAKKRKEIRYVSMNVGLHYSIFGQALPFPIVDFLIDMNDLLVHKTDNISNCS
jgi:hypothetical protein